MQVSTQPSEKSKEDSEHWTHVLHWQTIEGEVPGGAFSEKESQYTLCRLFDTPPPYTHTPYAAGVQF